MHPPHKKQKRIHCISLHHLLCRHARCLQLPFFSSLGKICCHLLQHCVSATLAIVPSIPQSGFFVIPCNIQTTLFAQSSVAIQFELVLEMISKPTPACKIICLRCLP